MPLLSPSTVQAVRDLTITQVLEAYHLGLKGRAGKLTACCPFHDEKTASFSVDERKGFFKCFGCHAAGDGIAFVMKKDKLEFAEAVEEIAKRNGIPVEHEDVTHLRPEDKERAEAEHRRQVSIRLALTWAAAWFAGHDLPLVVPKGKPDAEKIAWAKDRGLTPDLLGAAGIGYAPAGWDNLLTAARQQQYSDEVLLAAGLIKERDGQKGHYYDRFRERVMFPIRDWRGQVVAFTGRYQGPDVPADKPQPAKYLNSPDETWQKGAHLYGLDLAEKPIRQIKPAPFVYCVEGQIDVLAMSQAGAANTVAVGGTALTEQQVKLLGRYAKKVVLVPDHDRAGLKALDKQAAQLLAAGFDVRVLLPEQKGHDPADYLAHLKKPADRLAWLEGHRDYLTHHLVGELMKDGELGPQERAAAVTRLGELLETIPETVVRDMYYDSICDLWKYLKKYKLSKRTEKVVKQPEKDTPAVEREPSKDELEKAERELAQLKETYDYGFYEADNCYFKMDRKTSQRIKITNYTIKILYFVRAGGVSRLVCQFSNEFRERRQAVLTTDDLTAAAALDKCAARLGNFVFFGKQEDLNNLRVKLMSNVPYAQEVERLGRNSAGFYAWANGLLLGSEFFPADRNGFVRTRRVVADTEEIRKMKPAISQLEVNGEVRKLNAPDEIFNVLDEAAVEALVAEGKVAEVTYHYLPAAADLLTAGGGEGDDTISKFRHFNRGNLKFAEWSRRMVHVYGEANGRTLVAFYVAALFRTVIFRDNNGYFPLLYHFGQPQSGKSTSARSLARMFGIPFDTDGTNLEGGSTQTGIGRLLATVEDGIIWLNEYKNSLPTRMLGTLKGIADGSGKLLGMNTSGNETKVSRPRSAAVVGGQDLPTQDPALFSRCIINEFDGKYHQPQAQKELQVLEENGHTTAVTCEVLAHYDLVAAGYKRLEPTCTKELRDAGAKLLGTDPNSRAILNLTSLLTPCRLLMQVLDFGFTYQQLQATLLTKLTLSTEIQSVSDDVETYLQVLAGLNAFQFVHGEHYQIQKEDTGREVLLLRVAAVHGLYLEAARRQGFTPLGVGTMRSYLKKHPTFIEERTHERFSGITSGSTSGYAFDYYKIRQQGIDFRTTTLLADIAGKPIHVNGNLPELLADFFGKLAPGPARDGFAVLAEFNRGKEPAVGLEAFKTATNGKTYFGMGGAVAVSWRGDQLLVDNQEAQF